MKLCQLCHGAAEPSQNPCQARLASPRERLKDVNGLTVGRS